MYKLNSKHFVKLCVSVFQMFDSITLVYSTCTCRYIIKYYYM